MGGWSSSGSGSSGGGWGSGRYVNPYASFKAYKPPKGGGSKGKSSHHSFLGNLVNDIVTTGKGIPMGVVQMVHHPIRSVKQSGEAIAHEYSPLVHGHFRQFGHEVYQHPLTPMLDALSIAALAAGGVGVGIKAGASVAEEGSAVARAAELVRPGTRFTQRKLTMATEKGRVGPGGLYKNYSPNLYRRYVIQKPTEAALKGAGHVPGLKRIWGQGGIYDMTDAGQASRALSKEWAKHSAGASNFMGRQMIAMRKMLKDKSVTTQQLEEAIGPRVHDAMLDHALPVKPGRGGRVPRIRKDMQFVYERGYGKPHTLPGKELDQVANFLKTHGDAYTIARPAAVLNKYGRRAFARDHNGNFLVVQKNLPKHVGAEMDKTYRAMHALYHTPTKVWKWMVLGAAPRYFVNNVVGNSLMLAFSGNPVATTKAIHQAISDVHGTKVAERAAKTVEDKAMAHMAGDWQNRWYQGAHQGLFHDLQGHGNLKNKITQGTYGVTSKVAHTGPRRVALIRAISQHPEFQRVYKMMRSHGDSQTVAFRNAANWVSADPAVRSFVEEKASNVMGQYYHYNTLEKGIKTLVPFYAWDRHVMRFSKNMVLDHPYVAGQLARTGQQGADASHAKFGNVPDFLTGAIPIGHHGGILGKVLGNAPEGRQKILLTAGLNPLSSAADVVKAGAALTVGDKSGVENGMGEALGGQLNPIVQGAVEQLTGQSMLSGAKIKRHGGLITGSLYNAAVHNPVGQVADSLINGQPHPKPTPSGKPGKPFLYAKDKRQSLSSLLGLSERDLSLKAAHSMYDRQHGIKKGRKRSKKYKPPTFRSP